MRSKNPLAEEQQSTSVFFGDIFLVSQISAYFYTSCTLSAQFLAPLFICFGYFWYW